MTVTATNTNFPSLSGDPTQPPLARRTATAGEAAGTDELTTHARGIRVFTTAGNIAYLNWEGVACFLNMAQLYVDNPMRIKKIQSSNAYGTTTAAGFEILE